MRQLNPRLPICSAIMLMAAAPASAQTEDFFHPYASYSYAYDSNVLGLPSSEAAVALTGSSSTSDTSRSAQAGLQIDKLLGRQHLTANLAVSNVKFDRYAELDYQGRNLQGLWEWTLGNHLEGTANATYVRTLTTFDTFHALVRRLRTDKHGNVDFRWQFHPRWSLRGGLGHDDSAYSDVSQERGARHENYRELGLDFVTRPGSTVGVVARNTKGAYPMPIDAGSVPLANDFDQDELRARVVWKLTDRTIFQFRGGEVRRKHKTLVAKDFRGGNVRTSIDWTATGHTVLNVSAWRELGVVDDLFTAYSVNKGMSVGPRWAISDKLQADFQARYESRDFRPSLLAGNTSQYGDVTRSVQSTLSYQPSSHWLLQSSIFHAKKEGRGLLTDFSRNGANVSVQYQF